MGKYRLDSADLYWSKRMHEKDELSSVLSFNAPYFLNDAYSKWEIQNVIKGCRDLSNKVILDMACGTGRVFTKLIEYSPSQIIAVDNSTEMIKHCERLKKMMGGGKNTNILCKKGSADNIPIDDNSVDITLCLGLLEHLPIEHESKLISEIHRISKEKSIVIMTINNDKNPFLIYDHQNRKDNFDGYICRLVDRSKIINNLEYYGFSVSYIANNLFYSILENLLKGLSEKCIEKYKKRFKLITQLFCKLDEAFSSDEILSDYLGKNEMQKLASIFANHFIIKSVRSK